MSSHSRGRGPLPFKIGICPRLELCPKCHMPPGKDCLSPPNGSDVPPVHWTLERAQLLAEIRRLKGIIYATPR